jgi:acyl carrier protein
MTIASRTPEGLPNRCPICGATSFVEPSIPPGDAPCPRCGHLLWWFRERLGDVPLDASFSELNLDSLDVVELAMKAESEFGVSIPDEDDAHLRTVADVIRYVSERIDDESEPT